MSPTSYQTAPPRIKGPDIYRYADLPSNHRLASATGVRAPATGGSGQVFAA